MGVGLGAKALLGRPRQPEGELLERFREQMLATARRYSAGPHDAEDAYQRAAEIVLARQPTGTEELCRWVRTTVKHEALAIRRQQRRATPASDALSDPSPSPRTSPSGRSAPSAFGWEPRRSRCSSPRRSGA